MNLAEIPEVRLLDRGVSFKYLILNLKQAASEKTLVRAINYRPYSPDLDQQIINRTWDELAEHGGEEGKLEVSVIGGGTLSLNPYYETITLFGENGETGSEENRPETARLLEQAFPESEVSWFSNQHAELEAKKAKAALLAKRRAAAAKKAKAGSKRVIAKGLRGSKKS